jgi:hypothetical protein
LPARWILCGISVAVALQFILFFILHRWSLDSLILWLGESRPGAASSAQKICAIAPRTVERRVKPTAELTSGKTLLGRAV